MAITSEEEAKEVARIKAQEEARRKAEEEALKQKYRTARDAVSGAIGSVNSLKASFNQMKRTLINSATINGKVLGNDNLNSIEADINAVLANLNGIVSQINKKC